ncbi:unnamed protein product [Parnassius mnemosyne]|uniref:Uncharacterized protein n=1 Tax=Parnassius mnemosyne TaxID=213953 RepID=A0AAV1KQ32_9NEOP
MSPVCHSFVQNAWKKDFCSNCFKAREEHVKQDKTTESGKYLATPLQNRSALYKKTPPSILKSQTKKINKRNVRFPEEVSSVIGYGGDDWSDGEEFEVSEDNDDEDIFPDTEEERELYKITKSNTDFNTVKANLLGDSVAKSYTSLMLGKVQTDSDGKKKTLMVSVTPFGQENKNPNVKTHTRKPAVIHINEAQAEEAASNFKTNIILTSYIKESETIVTSESVRSTEGICTEKSLLEEISETLQQNRMNNNVNNINLTQNNNNKPTVIEEKRKESMQDEVEKKEMTETRKNGIVRKSPLIKTQERPKVNLSRSEFKFCKINIENSSVDSAVGTLNSTANNSLTSDDESFSAKTDSDNDDSGHFSETNKCEETVKIKVFNEKEKSNKISPMGRLRQADGKASSGYSTFQSPIIDMPPIIPKQADSVFSAEASRELAGEPDGRADPDESNEAPALPNSPVPTMDPRPSFLHGMITDIMPSKPAVPEKPKLPTKPVIKQTTKKSITTSNQIIRMHGAKKNEEEKSRYSSEEKNNQIKEVHEVKTESIYYAKPVLTKQDSDTSLNSICKRKAPTPPLSPTEEYPNNLYQRNPSGFMKSDSPVVRELEKRERAVMSSSPKTRTLEDIDKKDSQPEPAPRRSISLSHDNLLLDDKRKGKLKFSIKKLLRIGSSKDLDKKELSVATVTKVSHKTEEIYDLTPKPKPRLVIIHPLDINGSSVEVVKSNCEISESLRRMSHDDVSIYSGSSSATDVETPKISSKPPPPPRTSSEDANFSTIPKPARPPPPKSADLQKKQKQQAWSPTPIKTDNIYANLGEIRSALAPRKPERTASMRERESHLELLKRRVTVDDDKDELDGQQELVQATNDTVIHSYDDVYNSGKYDEEACDSAKNSDSDYEYVHHARSSSPECDSAIKPSKVNMEIRPDTKIEENNVEFPKYNNSFNRSSLPYCGSETESEIYSPYSFYSSNDNMDGSTNDDYQNEMTPKTTTNKLRVRKGRSVVHKNLEDNYGAVVIANHEALAQVLEQVQQSATMQPSLRGLKACTNLRWSDFNIQPLNKGSFTKAGKRVFYSAIWNSNQGPVNVTLMLYKDQMASQIVCQQSIQPQTLSLNAITEFCDLVPLQQFGEEGEDLVQATIVVLGQAQVDTIQSYGKHLHSTEGLSSKENQLVQTEQMHEAIFMLLQLINGLKCLQARGVEEISDSLNSFISLKEQQPTMSHGSTLNLPSPDDRLNSLWAPKTNSYGRLCILQGLSDEVNCNKSTDDEQYSSLCKCAIKAVEILLPGEKLTPLLKEVLQEERAISLNQAKSVLEFMLWGPLDVVQGVPVEERELSLQRWLDLERATVLHGLVRTRVQLNVFEQLHLMFLVRSTAKAMCDASVLLEKANVY